MPDPDSRGFWDYAAQGQLSLQRCNRCGEYQFPALESCRKCRGGLEWIPVSGRATVHTYIVQHHAATPGFDGLRPFVVALVLPEEAPHLRIPGRVLGAPESICIGAAVVSETLPLQGGPFCVPVFRLSGHSP
jgi:hypothetical protein